MFRYQNQGVDQMGLLRPVVAQSENKCPTNFSLSSSLDKLKLVGHQTDPLPLRPRRFTIPAGSSLRHVATMAAVVVVSVLSLSSNAAAQGSNIKGKVVADIPVRRKALSGIIVSLSGDRLAGKKLQSV